jgi:hypothetical protein
VDNLNLNKISPLLSSAERVKRVDRRQRNSQQLPFKGPLQGKQKKKKKKKEGPDGTLSEAISSRDSPRHPEHAVPRHQEKGTESKAGQSNKIIDIRV